MLNSGHLVNIDNQQEFNRVLLDFPAAVGPPEPRHAWTLSSAV